MNIYTIIPVHNRKKLTEKCLECLYSQTFRNFKIIVFDDGSSDGTEEMIKGKYPDVILLKGDGNCWWSRSVNEGIKYALANSADYILLLNDDVTVKEDYIKSFINVAEKQPNIIMGSAGYDAATGKLVFAGEKRSWITASVKKNADMINRGVLDAEDLIECDYLPGRGLWIPAKVFKTIGLFDDKRFPQSAADYDCTIRARKAGFNISCNMKAKVWFSFDDTGSNKYRAYMRFQNFWQYITSIKSVGNLFIRWKFGIKNCPPVFLAFYLLFDTARIIGGYFIRCFKAVCLDYN